MFDTAYETLVSTSWGLGFHSSSVMNFLAMYSRLTEQVSQHCVSHPVYRALWQKRWTQHGAQPLVVKESLI